MKITKNNIHDLAKSILFENNINELRLPLDHDMDAGKNNRTSALDQPGPQIDGDGNYKKSWKEDLDSEHISLVWKTLKKIISKVK